MRTIKVADAISKITNKEDISFLQATGMETLSEEEVREYCTPQTADQLFDDNSDDISTNHPSGLGYIGNYNEENAMDTTTTTKTLTYCGIEFACEYKMDLEFAGKTITAEDFGNLSKAMLLEIAIWQAEHITSQDTRTVQQQVERGEQRTKRERTPTLTNLSTALWASFSPNQREWLNTEHQGEKRGNQITFEEVESGRVKIHLGNLSTNSKNVIAKVIAQVAKTNNWYCKIHYSSRVVRHVYVNMNRS